MTQHVFVLGMTPLHHEELRTVHEAGEIEFHELLDHESLVEVTDIDFDDLARRAREQLDAFDGTVDGIISHWDFPTSILGPLLAAEHGQPAPSLTSLLKCEHKYWSRLAQREAVPDVVPGFVAFDPFADDVAGQIELEYPFWVKPIKGHSSNLGFEVRGPQDLQDAVERIRAEITDVGDAFDQVLRRVDLPPELSGVGGNTCLAEEIIEGVQFAPEGAIVGGAFSVHGVIDMHKDESGLSIERLDYPASLVSDEVQQRAIDATRRLLEHIGYDDGCFNSEFMWDEKSGRLRLIEVNTRISQSHSELFTLVDGRSNHQVAVDVALGRPPRMPEGHGDLTIASQYKVTHERDAVVRAVPGEDVLAQIERRYPGTKVEFPVEPGYRLSELPHQDSYRYVLAVVYVGAPDKDALATRIETIEEMLQFHLEDYDEGSR